MSDGKFEFGERVTTTYGVGRFVRLTSPEWCQVLLDDGRLLVTASSGELHPLPPTPPPNTVPVRIAVAVAAGRAAAAAVVHDSDDEPRVVAHLKGLWSSARITFVTAHVPLPEPPAEVAGEVERG